MLNLFSLILNILQDFVCTYILNKNSNVCAKPTVGEKTPFLDQLVMVIFMMSK